MNNKTALIVDDSKLSRVMIRTILQDNFPDWKVLEAANADEALELKEDNIDIMTLDMNMPGMDGVTLGIEMKKRFPTANISLITANVQQAVRDKAADAKLQFIAKPITEEKILKAIGVQSEDAKTSTPKIVFDGDELDVLSEFFNMGMGQAAESISQMLAREVLLSVPSVRFTSHEKSINEMNLKKEQIVVCVSEEFDGIFNGKAHILFPETDSRKLVQFFTGGFSEETEEDVMIEMGNILINSCLAMVYNLLDSSYECDLPQYTKHKVLSLFQSVKYDNNNSQVLVIEMDFKIDSTDITGNFRLLMDLTDVNELKGKINEKLCA